MTRYTVLRKMDCDPITALWIAFLNLVWQTPRGYIVFLNLVIEYEPKEQS